MKAFKPNLHGFVVSPDHMGYMDGFLDDLGTTLTNVATTAVQSTTQSATQKLQSSIDSQLNKILGTGGGTVVPTVEGGVMSYVVQQPAPAPIVQQVGAPVPKWVWYVAGGVGGLMVLAIFAKIMMSGNKN
jgi:hypothetical protein